MNVASAADKSLELVSVVPLRSLRTDLGEQKFSKKALPKLVMLKLVFTNLFTSAWNSSVFGDNSLHRQFLWTVGVFSFK